MKRRSVLQMLRIDGRKPRQPWRAAPPTEDQHPLHLPDVTVTAEDEREVFDLLQQHGILSPI